MGGVVVEKSYFPLQIYIRLSSNIEKMLIMDLH